MEIFVHKQAFSVFIEDLYPIVKRANQAQSQADSQIRDDVQIFYHSLRYLVNHNQEKDISDFIKFSEKSMKQLRAHQNESINEIYKSFKQSLPKKLSSAYEDYRK